LVSELWRTIVETVIQAGGKFYVYATGNGLPAFVSSGGWTWRQAGSVMRPCRADALGR
jgi:hypothetical protein